MRPVPRHLLLTGALLAACWSLPSPAAAQLCTTTRTECLDQGLDLKDDSPRVSVWPLRDTVTTKDHRLRFSFGDDHLLDPTSVQYTMTGGTLNGGDGWTWVQQPTSASGYRDANLAPGANTVIARVCDTKGKCSADTLTVFYLTPAPPAYRAAPVVTSAYSGERRNLATCDACSETVLSYTTPPYVSLDQPRAVQMMYSSGQARPMGYLEVDVMNNSADPPVRVSMTVMAGATVVSPETFYQSGNGTQRLAATWDAGASPTSASYYNVVVRTYWSDGSYEEVTEPFRVIIVNEKESVFGAGWSLAGIQRLHLFLDYALITDGAGTSVVFLAESGYGPPVGEASELAYQWNEDTFTRRYPDGSAVTFNSTGLMTAATDRFGNATTVQWSTNAAGISVPVSIIDPTGKQINLTYHTGSGSGYGKLASVQDPFGRTAYFAYADGFQNLTSIQDPAGGTALQVTYNAPGHLATGWTDVRGGTWNVTYGAGGKVATLSAPVQSNGSSTGRQTTTIRSREAAVLPLANTGSSTFPARRVPPDSVSVVVTPPLGLGSRLLSDALGNATRISDGSDSTMITRNPRGQVLSVADDKGNLTRYTYDRYPPYLTREVETWGPNGASGSKMAYGPHAQLTAIEYSSGLKYLYDVDALGRTTSVRLASDTLQSSTYDTRGRVLTQKDAGGHLVTFSYLATGSQNLSTMAANSAVTAFQYDAFGRSVSATTDGVPSDSVGYDVLNRTTAVRDPNGAVTTLAYVGSQTHVRTVLDPLGQQYQTVRNTLGQVTQEIDPASRNLAGVHDPATGTLTSTTNRRGGTVSYQYDAEGRITHRAADGQNTTWSYDPARSWATVGNAVSRDSVVFDPSGAVTEVVTHREGLAFSIRHTYNDVAQADTVYVSGPWGTRSYAYIYDDEGRLEAIRDFAIKWTKVTVNAEGLPTGMLLPTAAGMQMVYQYTANHQLSKQFRSGGSATSVRHHYEYSTQGLITSDSLGTGFGYQHYYDYDALGRIATWELHKYGMRQVCGGFPRTCSNVPSDSIAGTRLFDWDAVGNPEGAPLNAGNRLRAHRGYSMDYDLDGNLVRKYNASGFDQTLVWNTLGQLVSVSRAGGETVTYGYDGTGRRVRRTDHSTGAVVHSIYDGDDLVLEVDGNGSLLREYTYFPGIDTPHSMRNWANGAGGPVYYYLMQQPGHVNALVNANDQVVNTYHYTPFGEAAAGTIEGIPNPLQYMGRELDRATGLYYVRNRWYDPQQGRFVSEDPIGLAGGLNQYAYVGNNPIHGRDPTGLACEWPEWEATLTPYRNGFRITCSRTSWGQILDWSAGWGTAFGMLGDWFTGTGPEVRSFGPGSRQVRDMQRSRGITAAREMFCSVNKDAIVAGAGLTATRSPSSFGFSGLVSAGLNPTQQFVGSYIATVTPSGAGETVQFRVWNNTSFTSASYQIGFPSWSRQAGPDLRQFGISSKPMGNMYQAYTWSEQLSEACQ